MAAILKLLHTVDPKTRQYIRYYKITEVYECLLSGLAVVRPDDCVPWLINSLETIQKVGIKEIKWDMFIPAELRPAQRPIDDTTISHIFNFLDEMLEPSDEMIQKACLFYNKKLHKKMFFAWLQYYLMKTREQRMLQQQIFNAEYLYKFKLTKSFFNEWMQWSHFRKDRHSIAQSKLSRALKITQMRTIMDQWHIAAKEARQTREYFERLERGENIQADSSSLTNGEARDDISALPRNAAVHIFSYLSVVDLFRCAQVCRSWKMITNSNILWSKIDFYPVRTILTDKVIAKVIQKCRPYLLHLNIRGCALLTKHGLLSISACRNLQDLNLSDVRCITDDFLNAIITGCHILLYLNVSYNDRLTDVSLRCMAKHCVNLQYLSMSFCKGITDKGFTYLSAGVGLRKLIYLDVSGCNQLTPYSYTSISNYCKCLETFVINDFPALTDRHLKTIAVNSMQLTSFIVMDSPFLTDEAFRHLCAARNLQKIKVSNNHSITDVTFKALARNCLNLRHVYITDCVRITDSTLKSLAMLKNLIVLNIADCVRVSDVGVKLLSEGESALKLRELNFTNCVRIGNSSLIALKKCKNITYLALCFCEHIEEDGLDNISHMDNLISVDLSGCKCGDHCLKGIGTGGKLKHASFSGCKDISDIGLQKFCTQCPSLETLDLSYCPQLTDSSIKSLAFCCKLIMNLNLCSCSLLTDMSLQYLSGVCAFLQTLDVSYCQSITDKGMKYLRKGCKYLKRLLIINCRYISRDTIEKLQQKIAEVEFQSVEADTTNQLVPQKSE